MKRPVLLKREGEYLLSWEEVKRLSDEALLYGGFSSEDQGHGPAPSPTLLLNTGFLSEEDLLRLARAERKRFEENAFRSYVYDTREEPVAVFSKDPETLKRFFETYGGLFTGKAFCLTKSAEFPLIDDLVIQKEKGRYRLSYLLWSPVVEEKCHRCGECGRKCPKGAISFGPVIDPQRCDLCRECEKACPEAALELSRYEEIEENFGFLLFLDEIPPEIPRLRGRLFGPGELEKFFSRLGSFEISETIQFDGKRCQFIPRFGCGCELCHSVCLEEALKVEDEIFVDHFLCLDCGRCVSSCPTGALVYAPFKDEGFIPYLHALPLKGRTVVVGREEDLARFFWSPSFPKEGAFFFLAHEAPEALGLPQLLSLLARAAARIILITEDHRASALANEILARLFGKRPLVTTDLEGLPEALSRDDTLTLGPFELPHFEDRRRYLARILKLFWEKAGKPSFTLQTEGFGLLEIDSERCTLCLACLNGCRTGALAADAQNFALTFEPALCVACRVCEKICPEKALKLKEGLFLEEGFFTRKILARDEPVLCRRCGKVFGTRKSLQKVLETLRNKEVFDEILPLLSYCEDCRVKELFEED